MTTQCSGCGESIWQDEDGHWAAADGDGWSYMCSAKAHQAEHAPMHDPNECQAS